jgi:hypothetical protein
MFIVLAVYASLSATPLIPLPFTSDGLQAHRFVPATVNNKECCGAFISALQWRAVVFDSGYAVKIVFKMEWNV